MAETKTYPLENVSVDDIEAMYRKGKITAYDKNILLQGKHRSSIAKSLDEHGYVMAIFERTVENLQEGWDNLVEGFGERLKGGEKPKEGENKVTAAASEVWKQFKNEAQAFWGSVQVLTSALNAFGEVTGQKAENAAIKMGASPGLARVINIATDVSTGLIPVGTAAKGFAKGVQATGKKLAGETAKESAEAVAKREFDTAMRTVTRVLEEGLAADGVKITREAGEAAVDIARAVPLQETFSRQLAKIKGDLGKLSANEQAKEIKKISDKLGLNIDDIRGMIPGQQLDETHILAYFKAIQPKVDDLVSLAKMVREDGSEAAANAFAKHAVELFSLIPTTKKADIVQKTPVMKNLTNLLEGWDPERVAGGDYLGAIRTMADDVLALADNPDKLASFTIQAQHRVITGGQKAWTYFREAYINLMLLRPVTQVRVALGNTISTTNTIIEKTLGAAFSADRSKGLVGQEGWYFAKGMYMSLGDAFKQFGDAFKHLDVEEATKLDYLPHQIPGILGRIINAPGDAVRGFDGFFKAITKNGSLYASAIRDGVHRGLNGQALADHVAHKVNFPSQWMLDEADQLAKMNTFTNELGTIASKIRDIGQAGPLVLWFPFMKSPIQLAKYTWNRTPGLQLLSKSLYEDIMAGGVKADMAIGRLTMASMQGMFLFELAKEGFITGSGPADPHLRKAWLATHQPYSIRMPGGWMPIANMEPGSTLPGMIGDFAQVMNQLDDPTAGQAAQAITFAILHGMADKTWWRTLGDLVDITSGVLKGQEPSSEFKRVLIDPFTTIASGGPLGSAISRAIQPTPREVNPLQGEVKFFLDQVKSKVPGYSSTLKPKRDYLGDPILPPQSIGGPWLGIVNPITSKPYSEDPVKLEGDRLQVKGPIFPWHVGGKISGDFDITEPFPEDKAGVALTDDQRDWWQETYRKLVRHPRFGLEAMMGTDMYKKAPRAGQREMFMGLLSDHFSASKEALFIEFPDLAEKEMASELKSYMPYLQTPGEEGAVTRQFESGLELFKRTTPEQRANLMRWGIIDNEEGEQ